MAYYKQYQNYTPVSKFMEPVHIAGFCTAEESVKLVDYLIRYNGTFHLMSEMRDKFLGANGYKQSGLSEKQWGIVRNSMKRDQNANKVFNPVTLSQPINATLGRGDALRHFKRYLKLKYAVFTVKVTKIESVTPSRNGQFHKLKLGIIPNTDGKVDSCRMCGKPLTDDRSIASGVGPTCAKKLGAGVYKTYKADIAKFMEEFKKEVDKIGETTIEVWDANIRSEIDLVAASLSTPVAVAPPSSPIAVNTNGPSTVKENVVLFADKLEWLPIDKVFSISRKMEVDATIAKLYQALKKNGDILIDVVNPKTMKSVKFELDNSSNARWTFSPADEGNKKLVEHLIISK